MRKANVCKNMKFNSRREVYNHYGRVVIIKTSHIGLMLDLIIPMTFGLITLFFKKKYNKEVMRITTME